MYFNYDNLEFRYEPYPIGISRPLMKPEVYQEFLDNYPEKHWFKYMAKLGHKYSLSEHFDEKKFYRFLRGNPLWNDFNKWIKSRDFVTGCSRRSPSVHSRWAMTPTCRSSRSSASG